MHKTNTSLRRAASRLRRSVACVVSAIWKGDSRSAVFIPETRSITAETAPKELRVHTSCESSPPWGNHFPINNLKIFDSTLQARDFSPLYYLAGVNRVPVKKRAVETVCQIWSNHLYRSENLVGCSHPVDSLRAGELFPAEWSDSLPFSPEDIYVRTLPTGLRRSSL
jgi:hypothetical protein